MFKNKTFIMVFIFLLVSLSSVNGETYCSYAGPDLSSDFLQLTNFSITGPYPLKVGDTITVKFNLKNYGQGALKLGYRGFFAAARDPDNIDTSFGFSYAYSTIKPGENWVVQVTRVVDKTGSWVIWPSYHLSLAKEEKLGTEKWHACTITAAVEDSDQDGIADNMDNCPKVSNKDQSDVDQDGIGDACDSCDDRDSDGDGIKNCLDKCPNEKETFNKYQDEDGCPDQVMEAAKPKMITVSLQGVAGAQPRSYNQPSRDRVGEGPLMPEAFDDGDGDGVLNFQDECPRTPPGKPVFENGCRCIDSDGGIRYYRNGTVSIKTANGTSIIPDTCHGSTLTESHCNPAAEEEITGIVLYTDKVCENGCENGKCRLPVFEAFPLTCASSSGTCADGVQNQDETGVDCGGKCPPCNTNCTTGTKYAPPDTPCTKHFVGGGDAVIGGIPHYDNPLISDESQSDLHRINLTWTDGGGECNCQFYEVCDPALDFVIEEAVQCCSSRSWDDVNRTAVPDLCREAIREGSSSCKKCVGLYIIKGLGSYARWMRGYHRDRSMDYYVCGVWCSAAPSERLINYHKTGICRDYSAAVLTLLRKAGYAQREVANFCDGDHCYNLVKLPGDTKWHVVDTVGNDNGIRIGRLPTDWHNYCERLNESNVCYGGVRTIADIDAYWGYYDRSGSYPPPPTIICSGRERYRWDFAPECGPGVACARDNYRIPDFGPRLNQIVGCS